MRIYGLQKLTLLDYPGKAACTVFTAGCNLRCPFCHNAALVNGDWGEPLDDGKLFAFLEKRRGILDGVAITGGEPTMQPDLPDFIRRVRELGYLVKLDTNGFYPDRLEPLLRTGAVDYVAMDIKSSPARYAAVAGLESVDLDAVRRSIQLLMEWPVAYEFRTTVVRELHTPDDIEEAARSIEGAERYFLQKFVDSGNILSGSFSACSDEEMHRLLERVRPYVKAAALRGVA